MSDKESLTLTILKNIQSDMSTLKSDISTLKSDMSMVKEAVRRMDARVASLDSYMGGFYSSLRWQSDELDNHRGRIEGLEDTLNSDKPTDE